jgi:hypothetical protein
MAQYIPDAGNLLPWDAAVAGFQFIGQMPSGF